MSLSELPKLICLIILIKRNKRLTTVYWYFCGPEVLKLGFTDCIGVRGQGLRGLLKFNGSGSFVQFFQGKIFLD